MNKRDRMIILMIVKYSKDGYIIGGWVDRDALEGCRLHGELEVGLSYFDEVERRRCYY